MSASFPEQVYKIFDELHEAVLMVDASCIVTYINSSYTRMTRLRPEDILGKFLPSVREGSLLPEVLEHGTRRIGVQRVFNGNVIIANIVPLYQGDTIIGGISLATEANDIIRLSRELEQSKKSIEKLKQQLHRHNRARYSFDHIITTDPETIEVKQIAGKIAGKDIAVLILGESGTGKELVAQAIHTASNRKNRPFMAVNCATLNAQLLESELFGYAPSAFTGAQQGGKKGIFEEAHGGTVFLDEVSELADSTQAKLLRVLQEGTIRPVGESFEKSVDVRIIAATNNNLFELVLQKRFRMDLYYRIASVTLNMKPLRDRRNDIALLADYFLHTEGVRDNARYTMDDQVWDALQRYDWPGNVRELYNCIRSSAALCDRDTITLKDLPSAICAEAGGEPVTDIRKLSDTVREVEQIEIRRALRRYGTSSADKRRAAKALGISLATLYNKLHGMDGN